MTKVNDMLIYDGVYTSMDAKLFATHVEPAFTFKNPEYVNALILGESTKDIDKEISFAKIWKDRSSQGLNNVYKLPRGYRALVDLTPEKVTDNTVTNQKAEYKWQVEGFSLRPWQRAALDAYKSGSDAYHGAGIVSLACGKGKTVLGIKLIEELQAKTLILVDQRSLATQWAKEVNKYLGVKAAMWMAQKRKIGDITIATLQSLYSHGKNSALPPDFFSKFSLVILDECHVVPARTFYDVMVKVRSKNILGLSATVERADGLTDIVTSTCGPVLYKDLSTDLTPQIYFNKVSEIPESVQNLMQWTEQRIAQDPRGTKGLRAKMQGRMLTMLTQNRPRNIIIASWIAKDYRDGHSVLVLTGRVDHCYELQRILKAMKTPVESEVVESSTKAKERERIFDSVRSGQCRVLIATSIAKKGLDLPVLSCVHLVFPMAMEEFINQGVGRALRSIDGKLNPLVRDYVDLQYPKAVKYFKDRVRLYNENKWRILNLDKIEEILDAQE